MVGERKVISKIFWNWDEFLKIELLKNQFFSGFWIRGQIGEAQEVEIEGPLLLASRQEGVTNSQEEPKQTKEIILEPIEEQTSTTMLNSSDYQTESYQLEDLFSENAAPATTTAENHDDHQ